MLLSQQQRTRQEEGFLAPYALRASSSKGRKYPEQEDPYRTAFQRDRDRIIHSKAFRRLSGKTQVFISGFGDHYRTRLTHSLAVAQVARDIARALGLNEDLVECIALAHDLGHTPFGHAGEEAMSEILQKYGDRFEHNDQSLRVVEELEKRSGEFPGLNLSFEVREGMMKHRSLHPDGKTPVVHSLESQVVDLADAIAYHHHDLDDGLRAGLLNTQAIHEGIELWRMAAEDLSFAELGEELYRHIIITRIISVLINDLIEATHAKLEAGELLVAFSDRTKTRVEQLAEFLGNNFYLHEKIALQAHRGQKLIKALFEAYSRNENLLPLPIREQFHEEKRHIVIKDFIAGMTDEFALKCAHDLGISYER